MRQPRERPSQWIPGEVRVYSLFQTIGAIELRLDGDRVEDGRLICSQKDYMCILDVGYTLAKAKGLQFINFVDPQRK